MKPRRLVLVVASLLFLRPLPALAQHDVHPAWTAVEDSPGTFRLDRDALAGQLAAAPLELTDAARDVEVVVSLPRPDGTLARFRVEESPILSPAMTAKYGIRTYIARGIDEPAAISRFDLGPEGFHALVLAPSGSLVIRPDGKETRSYLTVPYDDDPLKEETRCVAEDAGLPAPQASTAATSPMNTAGTISIYQLAASATGEFTAQNGNTVASALAAITTVINGVNAVYRRDFGIHLALVDDNDQLILTSPSVLLPTQDLVCGDGPATCLQVDCLLTGNQCLINGLIGFANYDIGVVFDATNASGGAAGRAELSSVCTNLKGRGATGGTSIDLAAHEIGHMFGGHHTFNSNTGGSCGNAGQRDASFAWEPGSGSTVMSYAGTCGATDLKKGPRDLDFHADNVVDVLNFIQTGSGSTCAGYGLNTGNYGPIILSSPGTHVVPASTPFVLAVDAYDPNSDPVTYSFDESDTGTASPPEGDDGSRPIYRVYPPSATSWRSFPSYDYVLNNANVPPATVSCSATENCLSGETLHSTSRTMQFSIILRDGVDAVTLIGATVGVDGTSGPFAVATPNETTAWTEGTQKVVFWNVAGTNQPLGVNCQNVRISLSTDNGSTWPYVLAASTPNDGAQLVTLPFDSTPFARIKVEAVGNIFYDVSRLFIIEPLRVTNLNDSGRGSLRQAILDANDYPTGATIPLQLPGSGVRTISVFSQLPAITKPIAIDAWDLGGPDYVGPPLLELAGGSCPAVQGVPCDGLTVLGDNSFINGIVVRNFGGNGIVLRGSGAYANGIQNCYIGTDATGAFAAGNGKSGLLIDGGYGQPLYGNFIGLNVISGNEVGVTIAGAPANGNAVMRNKIGLNAAGTARIPNLDDGVRIIGAPNTKIGEPGSGNVISGNGTLLNGFVNRYADAIDVSGSTATGTVIQGNIIGLDATGTTGIYNTAGEINVNGAPNTLIGGVAAGARNVVGDDGFVNYNAAHCIYVGGAGATGTVIQGNYLGTDATGTLNRGCRGAGVFIDGAPSVQLGGTTAAARNVISGNRNYAGIYVTNNATGTMIQGNYIGTNAAGTAAIPNASIGVELLTNANTIGGTAAGAGNVISGNAQRGIDIYECANNVIQGNFIGTNAAGTAALGNGTYGINLTRAPNNQIGGAQPGARNIISGNADRGIFISGGDGPMAPGNIVQGNYIGTDVTGSVGIGNAAGIELYFVRDATVSGNVISAGRFGNPGVRINSFGVTTSGIVIQGNKIGTNAAGTAPLGNSGEGIWASIAGTASILGNIVAASGNDGIAIGQGSFTIQGNWIGTDVTGTLDLRNTWSGISTQSTSPCLIGGTGPGEGNVIAFSAPSNTGTNHAGVVVGGNASRQQIRGNRIYSNTGLGIDLLPFTGVSGPDACDPDSGPNGSQNFPVLAAAYQSGSSTHVTGTLSSNASTTFIIDFYGSPSCDSLGYGEGATYLGSATVPTDGSCNASFDLVVPAPSSGVVTATATSPAGNTSEFSACRTVGPSVVAEVAGVAWASKSQLTWSAAAGATGYRVLRGTPAALPDLLDVDLDSCTRSSGAALTTGPTLTENPATAGIAYYWYLVVGSNGIDDGPYGLAQAGPRIANASGICP